MQQLDLFAPPPPAPPAPPAPQQQAPAPAPAQPKAKPRKGADMERHKALSQEIRDRLAVATHPTHGTGYVIHWRGQARPCGVTVKGLLCPWSEEWRIVSEARP